MNSESIKLTVEPEAKPIIGSSRDSELLKSAEYHTYSQTDEYDLGAYFFFPESHTPQTAHSPVIVFFHGGMWDTRMTSQFAPHALHFAQRGIVSVCVDYRVSSLNQSSPVESMEDARQFLSFLAHNSRELGIDPEQIIIGGASSGGHLALHLATLANVKGANAEHLTTPKALVLYAPISDTSAKGIGFDLFTDPKFAKNTSPFHLVKKDLPPLILFQGKNDNLVPFSYSEKLSKQWLKKKNKVELLDFPTARHIDFNLNVNPEYYQITVDAADRFLVELGLLAENEAELD